ncbi:MAG: hydroxymethylbilane synthase [Myxococcota bacterium]|nr:hydroxymethylbilane synthase [Myxococcota bacterium]
MRPIRIATRGSELALAQARYVASRIEAELKSETELVVIVTTGDQIQDRSLAKIGGKGLFIKEIEQSLLEDRADLAVHSAKDLPAEMAPGLELSAFPDRGDPRDALVGREKAQTLETLSQGARVGTGSTRRAAQLLALRPDLEIVPLRGNVPTRLKKMETEDLEAVILASAGLDRLGLSDVISQRIAPEIMLPAVCQGLLALQTREGDALSEQISKLDDSQNAVEAKAERAFLRQLGGDCTIPLAAHCEERGEGRIVIRACLANSDGTTLIHSEVEGSRADALALGQRAADDILDSGGRALLRDLRAGMSGETQP